MPILVDFNGAPHRVYLQVKPTPEDGDGKPRSVLVLFIEGDAGEPVQLAADQAPELDRSTDDTVRRLTEPHEVPGGKRSLGWDVDTSY